MAKRTIVRMTTATAAMVVATWAGSARADVDLVTSSSFDPVVGKYFSSTDPEVVAGCLPAGARFVAPVRVNVANTGDFNLFFPVVPAPACAVCPCTSIPANTFYDWSNKDCQWQVKNFVEMFVTNANDSPVPIGSWNPLLPIAKMQCLQDGQSGSSILKCAQGFREGFQPGFSYTQGATPCRHVDLSALPNGTYRYSVSVNDSGIVPEDRINNDTTVRAFTVSGGTQVGAASSAWQPAETVRNVAASGQFSTVVSARPHHVNVFYLEYVNGWYNLKVNHKMFDHWEGPADLGHPPGANSYNNGIYYDETPAAVSWGTDRLDVFVHTLDGKLWHRWSADGGWTWGDWDNPAGVANVGSRVNAAAWGQNRLDIVWTTPDHKLGHAWWGPGWGQEVIAPDSNFALDTSAAPTILARAVNRLTIVGVTTGSVLVAKSYDSGWSGWSTVPGPVYTSYTPFLLPVRTTEFVLIVSSFGKLQQLVWENGVWFHYPGQPSFPFDVVGSGVVGRPMGVSWVDGSTEQWDLFYLSGGTLAYQGELRTVRTTDRGNHWTAPTSLAPVASWPSAFTWGTNRIDLTYTRGYNTEVDLKTWF
jgi:hypothetical protein